MFILDTDVVSNLRKRKPHPALIRWIDDVGGERLATTVMTIMEIQIGIERARRSDPAIAERVQEWLAGILEIGEPQIMALDTSAAILLGRMRETPALRSFLVHEPGAKKTKTGADLAIAAIAIAGQAAIATNNDSDFLTIDRYFPLPGLFNPFAGKWLVEPHPLPGESR